MAAACSRFVDPPARETPFIYALLSPAPVTSRLVTTDSTPWALVATTRTPSDARYRGVERFRLRRARDGALFVWRISSPNDGLGGIGGVFIDGGSNANAFLREPGDSGGLGWRSLSAGDTYSLDVVSEGVAVTGRAAIPARPSLQLTDDGTAHIVRWPRASGAAGYFVRASDELGPVTISTDTAFVWCEHVVQGTPPPRLLRVVALDRNAFRYFADSTVASAGVTGALGLFGGANEARLELPGPPIESDPSCHSVRP